MSEVREHPFRGMTKTQMRARIEDALLCELDRRIASACFVECCQTDVEAGVAAGCDRRTVKRRLPGIIETLTNG